MPSPHLMLALVLSAGCVDDTIRRAVVDSDACEGDPATGDDDGDGVCNDRDQCPGTPGVEVNSAGCVPAGGEGSSDTDPTDSDDGTDTADTSDTDAPVLAADILFVVDNSASMDNEQVEIQRVVQTFVSALDAAAVDYHLGVTSTDTTETGLQGALAGPFLTPNDADVATSLGTQFRLGTSGSATERGAHAMYLAITQPDLAQQDANAGFLRAHAHRHVIFVTDEEDASFDFDSPFVLDENAAIAWANGMDTPARPMRVHAIASPVPTPCTGGPVGSVPAPSGFVYQRLTEKIGDPDDLASGPGAFLSVCAEDWTSHLAELASRILSP